MTTGSREQQTARLNDVVGQGNRPVRVLRIINRFNLGGPTYNVSYLTKYMAPEYDTLLIGGEKDESEASSDYIVKSLGL